MLYNAEFHGFCSEFYTVEKSIEVVADQSGRSLTVRINALRDEKTGDYSTRAYIQKDVVLKPAFDDDVQDIHSTVWVAWIEFPWTCRDSADGALGQALSFLRERCTVPGAPPR